MRNSSKYRIVHWSSRERFDRRATTSYQIVQWSVPKGLSDLAGDRSDQVTRFDRRY